MPIDRRSPIRIARPSRDLQAAEGFWHAGLGLEVLYRAGDSAEGGHALLMLGWPEAAWHLELVGDGDSHARARPTEEDLLVIYLGRVIDRSIVIGLEKHGGRRVTARNPFWEKWGVTIEDPDGYRLVLSQSTWSGHNVDGSQELLSP